jgi:hypothetical protein
LRKKSRGHGICIAKLEFEIVNWPHSHECVFSILIENSINYSKWTTVLDFYIPIKKKLEYTFIIIFCFRMLLSSFDVCFCHEYCAERGWSFKDFKLYPSVNDIIWPWKRKKLPKRITLDSWSLIEKDLESNGKVRIVHSSCFINKWPWKKSTNICTWRILKMMNQSHVNGFFLPPLYLHLSNFVLSVNLASWFNFSYSSVLENVISLFHRHNLQIIWYNAPN